MSYTPWPEDGCTLGEARERTADRALWSEWIGRGDDFRSRGPLPSWLDGYRLEDVHDEQEIRKRLRNSIDDCEGRIDSDFRRFMRERKLVAYGRAGSLRSEPALIAWDIWPALTATNWTESAVGENRRGGTAFFAVRVFPAMLYRFPIRKPAGPALRNRHPSLNICLM